MQRITANKLRVYVGCADDRKRNIVKDALHSSEASYANFLSLMAVTDVEQGELFNVNIAD